MNENFDVKFLEEAKEFLDQLDEKARAKILFNIWKVKVTLDKELLKKLTDEIWEFRTLYNKTHYRLFAFWDKTRKTKTLIIATHGIIKKTDKTPKSELKKAEKIRKLYFE